MEQTSSALRTNANRLGTEINWLESIITFRLNNSEASFAELIEKNPTPQTDTKCYYDNFILSHTLSLQERLLLILSITSVYMPEKLDGFLIKDATSLNIRNPKSGGEIDIKHGYFYPTVKTLFDLLAGYNNEEYAEHWYEFTETNKLVKQQIIVLSEITPADNNMLASKLRLSPEYFNHVVFGKEPYLEFSPDFPVKLLSTDLDWKDMVLDTYVLEQLEDFVDWHENKIHVKQKDASIKEGYISLFYGPPGTGKTMAAALLGKRCGLPVYRIDVSMIVSKWVGETGKNIKRLFEKIKFRECILFFDEADSLFSVRTGVDDAQDKYANQEIATLLLEIEEYKGMCVMATNLENNIDKAFRRRLQSQILFERPTQELRRKLWEQYLPKGFTLHESINLDVLAKKIDATGANIKNIYKMCSAKAAKRKDYKILGNSEIVHYARLELWKEGRLL